MKTKIMLAVLGAGLVAVWAGLLMGDGDSPVPPAPPAEVKEVSKNPALLISPALKAGELSVYGVKLGDSPENILGEAAVTATAVPERPLDIIYTGYNVRYYTYDKKIYRITVMGDLTRNLPTYDAARLQMAMNGKADEAVDMPSGEGVRLSFFARHVRYTVRSFRVLSLVTEVDLYAP